MFFTKTILRPLISLTGGVISDEITLLLVGSIILLTTITLKQLTIPIVNFHGEMEVAMVSHKIIY